MKKIKSILYIFLFFLFILTIPTFAKTGNLNSVDYNILVRTDSKLEVIEVWDVSIDKSVQLIDKKIPVIGKVTDVVVKEYNKDSSVKVEYEQVQNEDELTGYKFYVKDNDIKIHINENKDDKQYFSIKYVIEDCINVYLDCAEFDLVLQDKSLGLNTDEITGKISFESEVNSLVNYNTWIHSINLSSVTKVDESSQINFYVDGNKKENQLDVKVVFPTNVITVNSEDIINGNRLRFVFEEEISKSEKKIEEDNKEFIKNVIILIIGILSAILVVILVIILIVKKVKTNKKDIDNEDKKEVDMNEQKILDNKEK